MASGDVVVIDAIPKVAPGTRFRAPHQKTQQSQHKLSLLNRPKSDRLPLALLFRSFFLSFLQHSEGRTTSNSLTEKQDKKGKYKIKLSTCTTFCYFYKKEKQKCKRKKKKRRRPSVQLYNYKEFLFKRK